MKSLLTKPNVQITWMLLLLLHQQLLLAQDQHDFDNHHQQRHHHLEGSNNSNNNNNNNKSKLTSTQLVAQKTEHHHHYNYQQQQQVQHQEKNKEREQHHNQHNKHHNHQRHNAINFSGASKSSLAHQQYYQQSSTVRPMTANHNFQQQEHHTAAVKLAHNHHHHHHHQHTHAHTHQPNHQKQNQRHAHDHFIQISPPSMADKQQNNNNNNNHNNNNFERREQKVLVQEPSIDYKVVGRNNWFENSLTGRKHAHMTDDNDDVDDDDMYVADNSDYYDDMRDVSDDYDEQENARVVRHLPNSEYAENDPYRQPVGVMTAHKIQELSTKDSVDLARNKYLQENLRSKHRLAEDHFNRMKIATQCNRPMPRVVLVSNLTKRRYEPACTILHRCGEDTGCCNANHVCTVKTYETVKLYFYVYGIDVKGTTYEELEMTNHTECHCVNRYNLQRRKRSGAHHSHQQQNLNSFDGPQKTLELFKSSASAPSVAYKQPAELTAIDKAIRGQQQICHCPKHFDVFVAQQNFSTLSTISAHQWNTRTSEDCRCDCLSTNLPCQRLRDGEEGFPVDDRKCIAARRCRRPFCLYGEYNRQWGRCPRHKDKRNDYGSYG